MLALLVAITGVVMIFLGNLGWGLLLAVCAAALGAIGVFLQTSLLVNGGAVRLFAMVIAAFGIGMSVLG